VDRAVSLAHELLKEHKTAFESVELLPSGGGVFEVTLDGRLIFSKKAADRFPEYDEINREVRAASS
jgi:selenoprotein W-related protein